MSSVTAGQTPAALPAAPASGSLVASPLTVVLLGFAMSFAMSWPHLVEIWRDGTYFDTDDAMRLVQVRNWLGGQGWFDLHEHRLGAAPGLLMHWSRVVDVPVAALIRLFEWFAPVDTSERLARIVFPLALQLGLIAVTVHLGRVLAGVQATLPAMILVVLSGFEYEQFPAGRIDHHAPQITLLVGMAATALASLTAAAAWRAAVAALCVAVSLAISLENLPFIAVIVALLPLAWVVEPELARRPLLWFAARPRRLRSARVRGHHPGLALPRRGRRCPVGRPSGRGRRWRGRHGAPGQAHAPAARHPGVGSPPWRSSAWSRSACCSAASRPACTAPMQRSTPS